MRTVRYSLTFNNQFNELLDQGEHRFGIAVVEQKKDIVYTTIERFLARHPNAKRPEPSLCRNIQAACCLQALGSAENLLKIRVLDDPVP
jgi:hypothetical protein